MLQKAVFLCLIMWIRWEYVICWQSVDFATGDILVKLLFKNLQTGSVCNDHDDIITAA